MKFALPTLLVLGLASTALTNDLGKSSAMPTSSSTSVMATAQPSATSKDHVPRIPLRFPFRQVAAQRAAMQNQGQKDDDFSDSEETSSDEDEVGSNINATHPAVMQKRQEQKDCDWTKQFENPTHYVRQTTSSESEAGSDISDSDIE